MTKEEIKDYITELESMFELSELEEHKRNILKVGNYIKQLQQKNGELKKQLDYLRSGEYYNQLRFENEMLQQVVDTNGVPSEVYDYIDCTHRNTELLEENQKCKEVINKAIEFINECMRDEDDDTDIDIVTSLLAYEVDELLDILKGVER